MTHLSPQQLDGVVARIWRRDHTVWSDDPAEITQPDRLGWLTVAEEMRGEVDGLRRFAEEVRADGVRTAVLLGMGGSSLAPEVLASTCGEAADGLALRVLDTTVPADILAVERAVNLDETLFIVASKSGSTIETASQLAYFWERRPEGHRFVAITDAGSPLATLAGERGFRRVFLNPPSVGGRYSALSYFGLVPAALIGADLTGLLGHAVEMQRACGPETPASRNPGASLGAALGEAALAGKDKLTLLLPQEAAPLGDWVEQLVAESTGKAGKGIIPIVGEPLGGPEVYGPDRLFVALGEHAGLAPLEAAGLPVVRIPWRGPEQLGAEFFRWEFATAVAAHYLRINPFDQPDVQRAKDATARILAGNRRAAPPAKAVLALLRLVGPADYVALLAYLPRTPATRQRLHALRLKLRERYHVATTAGFGPRYLHSTGQVHKGGPNIGVFFQLIADDAEDPAVPGQPYTFGQLKQAQADGDLESLLALGRRATRTRLEVLEAAL